MKKFLLTTLAALLCCVTAQAGNILVYKKNISVTTTGGGAIVKKIIAGWMIYDADNEAVTFIDVNTKAKKYIDRGPTFILGSVSGGFNKSFIVMRMDEGIFRNMFLKGQNKPSNVYLPTYDIIPAKFSAAGCDIYTESETFLDEYKGVLSFDKAASTAAVQENLDYEQISLRLIASLQKKGFTEE